MRKRPSASVRAPRVVPSTRTVAVGYMTRYAPRMPAIAPDAPTSVVVLAAFAALEQEFIPKLFEEKGPGGHVRVWSAGCATGEEAYSLAMVTAEALGADTMREQVKIYATDVDDEALNQARLARYADKQVEGVPQDLLGRYFERNGGGYVFSKDLRRSVIFGRNDLLQDAVDSGIDLWEAPRTA